MCTRRLDTDIDVSPPRKRVRFADCLPGRSLVDVCPIDFPVRRRQVPVHNKQVRNEQAGNVSDSVCSASVAMDLDDCSVSDSVCPASVPMDVDDCSDSRPNSRYEY